MRVTNFKTRFLKNGSSDHFGTNVPDLGSSSTLLGYKSPSYDFSKKFKVLLGRCAVLPALIGQRRHSADPGLVTRPCHWPHSASCPALGPASTASHSQQPQQPPGAGRASLHSLTEATLGKYFSQKKSFIFSSGHVSPMLNDSYLILAASMLSNGKQQ